jgi:hypothetical protein
MLSILSGLKLPKSAMPMSGRSNFEDKEVCFTSPNKDQEAFAQLLHDVLRDESTSQIPIDMLDSPGIEAAPAICAHELHISPRSRSQQICQREMTYVGCNLPLSFVCFQGKWLVFVLDFANMNGILATLTSHLFDLRTRVVNKKK